MDSFQSGDEVQQADSGPAMMVLWCTPDQVYCAWFEDSTLVNALFLPQELTLVRAGSGAKDVR